MTLTRNRSLDRGITLLDALARQGACSLSTLHAETGLAKSTIRRLLATMMDRQIVRRSLSDQLYRTNVAMPNAIARAPTQDQMLIIDVALPYLIELTASIEWPSDLHMLEDDWMHIVDSTRPLSPYHLYRGEIDRKINQFGSASGLACLSTMSNSQIEQRARKKAGDRIWGLDRFGMDLETYFAEIEQARLNGYGTRLHHYLGETVLDDSLAAIAVPLRKNGQTIAAITLLWPRNYLTPEAFAARYLNALNASANAIMTELEAIQNAQST